MLFIYNFQVNFCSELWFLFYNLENKNHINYIFITILVIGTDIISLDTFTAKSSNTVSRAQLENFQI